MFIGFSIGSRKTCRKQAWISVYWNRVQRQFFCTRPQPSSMRPHPSTNHMSLNSLLLPSPQAVKFLCLGHQSTHRFTLQKGSNEYLFGKTPYPENSQTGRSRCVNQKRGGRSWELGISYWKEQTAKSLDQHISAFLMRLWWPPDHKIIFVIIS